MPTARPALLLATLVLPGVLVAQKPTQQPAPGPTAPARSASSGRFAAVDAHADAAPDAVEQSVATLAAYLAQAGPGELSRARALFRWMAGNVDYDVNGLRTGNFPDASPDAVLRSRSSVCEGYARLSEALGEAMGLEVEVVRGWSKGYGYTTGQRFDGPTNHAWSAVRIGGEWRLMDATWGAGYLDDSMRFRRRFLEHYFLTPPEVFVIDHLPEDPRWQLLERPVSADEYVDLAYARAAFFETGLRIGSHPRASIAAADRLRLTFGVTRPVEMSAQLLEAAGARPIRERHALVQVGDTLAEVAVAFPRAGDYLLRLFARPRGEEGPLSWAIDYRIRASAAAAEATFPLAYTDFGRRGAWLFEPHAGELRSGRSYRFRLRVPGALDVAVVAGGRWTHLARVDGDVYSGEVAAAAGAVTVYARYEAGAQFSGLLRYEAR